MAAIPRRRGCECNRCNEAAWIGLAYDPEKWALSWFGSLTHEERASLDDLMAPLVGRPVEEWESRGGRRVELPETVPLRGPVFEFDLGPSIRVVVQPTPVGEPEIVDFLHQEMIARWRSLEAVVESDASLRAGSPS